jgi:hypothetical protein
VATAAIQPVEQGAAFDARVERQWIRDASALVGEVSTEHHMCCGRLRQPCPLPDRLHQGRPFTLEIPPLGHCSLLQSGSMAGRSPHRGG